MAKNSWALMGVIAVLVMVLGSSCAQIKRRSGDLAPRSAEPAESSPPAEEIPQRQKPKIALVLGPGAFKTFAYPSFLKAFVQAGVTPDHIVGVEWAALPAAIYALNGNAHEAEWKLFKLRKDQVEDTRLFGNKKSVATNHLRDFLKENLGVKSESETQIPFRCPLLRIQKGSLNWSSGGPLWQRVENCLASPPRFDPVSQEVPAQLALTEIATNLKREGYDVVILVNVLGNAGAVAASSDPWVTQAYWAETRRQLWAASHEFTDVIQIDTSRFPLFDFQAKTGLQAVGERIGQRAAQDLVQKYQL